MALTQETMIENLIKACERVIADHDAGEGIDAAYARCKLALDQVAQYTGFMCPDERDKLHATTKIAMWNMWQAGKTQKEIAIKYNVSQQYVSKVIKTFKERFKD
jgi:Mor family transcriptional regulator